MDIVDLITDGQDVGPASPQKAPLPPHDSSKAPLACPPLFKEIIEHDRLWFETMKDTVVDLRATTSLLRRKRELIRAA
jgi:hypothetical protein